ncbi:hypothetical protein OESDEN_10013 [Oesophagostomum dentatum]|uniref:Sulfur globule protein CV3 domain protein n=1 Tax=Oesophagostomum dentatum TaxID=61180 RepID=A0A0B1T314_OESDE|nr:hypothetical protein OESDEN_10013 [Oesophagostomum dentatum]
MNSSYLLIAFCLMFAQSAHAYFPYAGYLGAYPALGYHGLADPYVGVAPYAAGFPYYGHPYGLGYYHPRAEVRNIAKSVHREKGHLSDTSLLSSPFAKKN